MSITTPTTMSAMASEDATTPTSAMASEDRSEDSCDATVASLHIDDDKVRLTPDEKAIRKALVNRSYHLPGNGYFQDLYQYLTNNHPVIGIFLHHPLHPVGTGMRVVTLLGSVLFGLMITNVIFMAFVMEQLEYNKSFVSVTVSDNDITGDATIDNTITRINVTNGMIALWTVGAALNGLYDNLIWSVAACTCCLEGGRFEHLQRYRKIMPLLVMLLVVGTAAAASLIVLIVAASRSNEQNEQTANIMGIPYDSSVNSYKFLLSYGIEVLVSWAIWYPLMGALLFSGVLGCCNVPVFGGRYHEMRQWKMEEMVDDPIEEGQEITLTHSGKVHLDDAV